MKEFNESMAHSDPFRQFEDWFRDVKEKNIHVPNAMTLSTVNSENRPSARVVLLQNFSPEGFVFYTNYRSQKAKDIEQNPFCSVIFFWPELQRQVRIEGKLAKVSDEASDTYFMSRPYGSRLGAWASPQSDVIQNRKVLEEKLNKVTKEFEGKEVVRPGWWGGYILVPDRFEFWQERESRLHDRICYLKQKDGSWKMFRIAP
ncbi:MAG TPA: pyridoxamine 5'-phosphate oxidase [Bacteroidia bacterium]|nr:pyridoxamine 5'-phosphate oxidase [Bacteroidia bacterium]